MSPYQANKDVFNAKKKQQLIKPCAIKPKPPNVPCAFLKVVLK